MFNIQQGMANVQVRKRFALLILQISSWQNPLLGHWVLILNPPFRRLPGVSIHAGGVSLAAGFR
jgi:hypothetical protein